jgi:hypothetical protein
MEYDVTVAACQGYGKSCESLRVVLSKRLGVFVTGFPVLVLQGLLQLVVVVGRDETSQR